MSALHYRPCVRYQLASGLVAVFDLLERPSWRAGPVGVEDDHALRT